MSKAKISLILIDNGQIRISKAALFHNETKIQQFKRKSKLKNVMPESWKKIEYKAYPRFNQYILPVAQPPKGTIAEAIIHRRSRRRFINTEISTEVFSSLIFHSCGSMIFLNPKGEDKRFYPSAGARYPLEVYPFIFKVNGIAKGGYHYHIKSHSLEKILDENSAKQIFQSFDQPWLKQCAVLFVITSITSRTEIKYGDRAYRHVLTEYGHLAQNLYLVGQSFDIGCCSIGGFIDDRINRLLDLDFEDEAVVGVVAMGIGVDDLLVGSKKTA